METRNDIPNLLAMYIRNTREIYDITTWLQDCIIKKANKGIQPSIEYLANCSAMKSIIREAAKLLYKYDGITPTRQEKQQAAKEHAKYILDGVQYSIQYIIHKNKKHYDTSNSKKTAKQVANIFVNRPQKR